MRGFGQSLCVFALAAVVMSVNAAQAQPNVGNAPWCVVMNAQGGWLDCAYHTHAQCMAAASGVSNQCTVNYWSVPERPGPRPHPRPPRPWW